MSTRVNMHNSYLNPPEELGAAERATLPEGPRCPLMPSQCSDPHFLQGLGQGTAGSGPAAHHLARDSLHSAASAREKTAPPLAAKPAATSLTHKGRRGQEPSASAHKVRLPYKS